MNDGDNERGGGCDDTKLPEGEDIGDLRLKYALLTIVRESLVAIMAAQVDVDENNSDSSIRARSVLEDGSVTALSKLYFNHNWSRGLVHGPDMIFAFHELAETLLENGETVVAINSMKFRRPVNRDLQLYAKICDDNTSLSILPDGQNPAVLAEFATSNGRKIQLQGFKTASPIDQFPEEGYSSFHHLGRNFGTCTIRKYNDGKEIYMFNVEPLNAQDQWETTISPEGMNLAMDLVLYAFSRISMANDSVIPEADMNVVASLKFDVIPSDMNLCGGCKLELSFGKIEENGRGFEFIPVEFAFKKDGKEIGKGIFTIAQSLSSEVAERYCDRL